MLKRCGECVWLDLDEIHLRNKIKNQFCTGNRVCLIMVLVGVAFFGIFCIECYGFQNHENYEFCRENYSCLTMVLAGMVFFSEVFVQSAMVSKTMQIINFKREPVFV